MLHECEFVAENLYRKLKEYHNMHVSAAAVAASAVKASLIPLRSVKTRPGSLENVVVRLIIVEMRFRSVKTRRRAS